jgi:hypothetical protein
MERDRVIGGIANSQSPNQEITKSRNASLLDPTPAAEPAVNPSPAAAAGVPAFVPERGVLEAGEGRESSDGGKQWLRASNRLNYQSGGGNE